MGGDRHAAIRLGQQLEVRYPRAYLRLPALVRFDVDVNAACVRRSAEG
jgi:hypothetical protein